MKIAQARQLVAAALAHAERMDRQVTVVVVDGAGIPLLLDRRGDPAPFTSLVADGKAAASVCMGRDSREIAGMAERNPALAGAMAVRLNGRFAAIPGALVVREAGEVVGAIGVSGASADEDEEIARAGLATLA